MGAIVFIGKGISRDAIIITRDIEIGVINEITSDTIVVTVQSYSVVGNVYDVIGKVVVG